MLYFLVLSFLLLSVFTPNGVSAEYKPCLDRAGSLVCLGPQQNGMCNNDVMKELMKEMCAETCGFCP